jgi:hypothetical protein
MPLNITQTLNSPGPYQAPVFHFRRTLLDVADDDKKPRDEEALNEFKGGHGVAEAHRRSFVTVGGSSLYDNQQVIHAFVHNSRTRGAMKGGLRDTEPYTHEWIPCQLIADCMMRDSVSNLKAGLWSLLQVKVRSHTCALVFKPQVAEVRATYLPRPPHLRQFGAPFYAMEKQHGGGWQKKVVGDYESCVLLQGHEGGMTFDAEALHGYAADPYAGAEWQSYGSTDFHSQCLYAFDSFPPLSLRPDFLVGQAQAWVNQIAAVYNAWIWDPSSNTNDGLAVAMPFTTWRFVDGSRARWTITDQNFDEWVTDYGTQRADFLQNLQVMHNTLPMVVG